MIAPKTYVQADEYGVLRIATTGISLDSVVNAFRQGHAPETICDQYPALDLEAVYGAIAFYLANREEVGRYLEGQERLWEDRRRQAEQSPSPVVERLRALKAAARQEKR